ncbi:MAG: bifunctional DNA-formamidopyrimidine glycosylase/DNA-(apurinic or apyrimidinic site) lyase [Anaerolineae bacterium]|nr:bifunctional DNA-formamidopyrimidine glycosylase/DNA-(apurinic or apyrimidinic site) lyase [Anaerolineae bacterium]
MARTLRVALTGRTVARVVVLWPRTIDRPDAMRFQAQLLGARFISVGRRGKFLVMGLATGQALLVHLRMSGRFDLRLNHELPADEAHTRVSIELDEGSILDFVDPRKFGRFYLVEDAGSVLHGLGIEPLSPDFTQDWLVDHVASRRGEIKRLLLDQCFIAGLGNIYASESLWLARIHPARAAGSLSAIECQRLRDSIIEVLQLAIDHGGTSLADRQYVYPNGGLGEHQEYLSVYDRSGDACPRCGYALDRIVQGQRSTYYCPVCQPHHVPEAAI